MILEAGAALGCLGLGWISGVGSYWRIQAKRSEQYQAPDPTCGCGHHFALHNDGECGYTEAKSVPVERSDPYQVVDLQVGTTIRYKTIYTHEKRETVRTSCSCKNYTGPQPLPEYVAL